MSKYAGIIVSGLLAAGSAPALADDIVAARSIRAGEALSAEDMDAPKNLSDLRRALSFVGLEASRTIYKGQAIDSDDLRKPTLVERNKIVQMEYAKGSLTIVAEGRALDSGALGERIRVMNLFSKRIVTATIKGTDIVEAKI